MGVGDVLHPAAAAAGVIRTERRHTVMRRGDDPDKPPPGIALPDLGDLDLHLVPVDGEGDKDDQIRILADAVAAEGHIPDLRSDVIADLQHLHPFLPLHPSFRPPLPPGETDSASHDPLLESS